MNSLYNDLIEFTKDYVTKAQKDYDSEIDICLGYSAQRDPSNRWAWGTTEIDLDRGMVFRHHWHDPYSKKVDDKPDPVLINPGYLMIKYNDHGATGGNCYDGEAHNYDHNEPKDFNFNDFIKALHAKFFGDVMLHNFIHQLNTPKLISTNGYSENEYYGNYSHFDCLLLNLTALTEAMQSIVNDRIAYITLYDVFVMTANLDDGKGTISVRPSDVSDTIAIHTKLTRAQVKNAFLRMIDDAMFYEE